MNNAYKKQSYYYGGRKKRPPWSKKNPKRNCSNNYRLITSQPMLWKILTAQIREEIYYSLISRGLFLRSRKDVSWERKEQDINNILINTPSRTAKPGEELAMAWINDKKAYGIVQQWWIIHCHKIFKISDEVKFYREYHEKPESGTDSRRKNVCRGNNPERNVPWRFAINIIICKCDDTNFVHRKKNINHQMYMDDMKLFTKNWPNEKKNDTCTNQNLS